MLALTRGNLNGSERAVRGREFAQVTCTQEAALYGARDPGNPPRLRR